MTRTTNEELRAILLAGVVALALVVNVVAITGTVAAEDYGLNATDGAGGSSSFLNAEGEDQLPEGENSGTDSLTVKAENNSLPDQFKVNITLPADSNVTFDTGQNTSEIVSVVFGEGGSPEESDNISVEEIDEKYLLLQADYSGGDQDVPAAGVNVSNVTFDTGGPENVTLTWNIRDQSADYTLQVGTLSTSVDATDEGGGPAAAVTAGSANESMTSPSGATDPRLDAADTSVFPSRFNATLNVSSDGITFSNTDTSSIVPDSPYGDVTVVSVSSTSIKVSVENFDSDGTDDPDYVVQLSGVEYDVPPTADAENLTWSVLTESDIYELRPQRLDASTEETEYPRASDQQPDGGITVEIDGDGKTSDGFHAEGENMTLTIPERLRDNLSFDQSAEDQLDGSVDDGEAFNTDTPADISNFTVTSNTIEFNVTYEVGNEEVVEITGVRFNTTGHDDRTTDVDANLTSGLNVTYVPVDETGDVNITTDNEGISARAPAINATGPGNLSTDTQNQSTGVMVNITDTTGGQMAAGEDILIELEGDSNFTFNESQSIDVDAPGDQNFVVDDTSVTNDTITLSVDGFRDDSLEGDWLNVSSESGGLLFDTANDTNLTNASLAVTTNPTNAGLENVTQTTDTVVIGCVAVENVIDADNNNDINLSEVLDAASYYNDEEIVPGTCGQKIPLSADNQTDMLDIASVYNDDSKGVDDV